MLWTKAFWKGLAERAIKTGAQNLAASVAGGALGLLTFHGWEEAGEMAGLAMIASILTSLGSIDFVAGQVQTAAAVIQTAAAIPATPAPAAVVVQPAPDNYDEQPDPEDVSGTPAATTA